VAPDPLVTAAAAPPPVVADVAMLFLLPALHPVSISIPATPATASRHRLPMVISPLAGDRWTEAGRVRVPSDYRAGVLLPPVLSEPARDIATLLVERGEQVAVAESSAGGLISASLLSVPGASAYYLGGSVIYTGPARSLLDGALVVPEGVRGASEAFARLLAQGVATKLGATWGISETGAAGPTGNRYGDPAGHAWVAVWGPGGTDQAFHVLTDLPDREANMVAFAGAALQQFLQQLRFQKE
jgi:PncC family amidohydrolase